jgi:hypothetical protein
MQDVMCQSKLALRCALELEQGHALVPNILQGLKSRLGQSTGAVATTSLQGVFEQPATSAQHATAVGAAARPEAAEAVPDGSRKRRRWDVAGASAVAVPTVGAQAASNGKPVAQQAAATSTAARSAADRVTAGLQRRSRSNSSGSSSRSSRSSRSTSSTSSGRHYRRRRRSSSSSSSRSSRSSSRSSSSTSGGSGARRRQYPTRRRTSSPDSPRRC